MYYIANFTDGSPMFLTHDGERAVAVLVKRGFKFVERDDMNDCEVWHNVSPNAIVSEVRLYCVDVE